MRVVNWLFERRQGSFQSVENMETKPFHRQNLTERVLSMFRRDICIEEGSLCSFEEHRFIVDVRFYRFEKRLLSAQLRMKHETDGIADRREEQDCGERRERLTVRLGKTMRISETGERRKVESFARSTVQEVNNTV